MAAYEGWAIVELMGHRRRAGQISEVEMYGAKLLRLDVPIAEGEPVSEFYGGAAIYCVTPAAEDVARAFALRWGDVRPVKPVEFQLTGPSYRDATDVDFDEIEEFVDGDEPQAVRADHD